MLEASGGGWRISSIVLISESLAVTVEAEWLFRGWAGQRDLGNTVWSLGEKALQVRLSVNSFCPHRAPAVPQALSWASGTQQIF